MLAVEKNLNFKWNSHVNDRKYIVFAGCQARNKLPTDRPKIIKPLMLCCKNID